jgi:nicotinamide riboside kinase
MKCLLGSIGTGKTTVLKELQRLRPDVTTEEGFSRPIIKMQKFLKMSDYDAQLLINEFEIWGHLNRLPQKNLICTRSLLDTIIYCEILHPDIDLSEMRSIWERDYKNIQIFHIPIEFEMPEDEIRTGIFNKKFQKEIEEMNQAYINFYNIPIITVKGTVEERVNILLKYF